MQRFGGKLIPDQSDTTWMLGKLTAGVFYGDQKGTNFTNYTQECAQFLILAVKFLVDSRVFVGFFFIRLALICPPVAACCQCTGTCNPSEL